MMAVSTWALLTVAVSGAALGSIARRFDEQSSHGTSTDLFVM
jgi:hypothetical protein